jgi:hypothetical protein
MLLDFSADWQWIVGGTNVSPFVETWELSREQPDMGTPAWWRGKLVLRPVVGRDLNLDPLANPLWRQGTSCSLIVAGTLVFTGSILLAYYDDWSTAPRLELEVGDVLAAKNHRQVIPFGEYDAQSLLSTLGIPGQAPGGDRVEISTDLTSPVKVVQELTWVTWLKQRGLPATLFTLPDGQVNYVSPQLGIALTRTLDQIADFTRQRPALEIPGSVVASASLTYYVQPTLLRPTDRAEATLVSKEGDTVKLTYLDSFGRPVREEVYRNGAKEGYTKYNYFIGIDWYEIVKKVFVRSQARNFNVPRFDLFEYTKEKGEKIAERLTTIRGGDLTVFGRVVAKKTTSVFWPLSRLFPVRNNTEALAYLVVEYSIRGPSLSSGPRGLAYNLDSSTSHVLKLITRAQGTTQDTDTLNEAVTLFPTVSEIIPNQEIQFPDWVRRYWDPPKPERVTDALSEEIEVVGFAGPPVYINIPWLSVTVDKQPGSQEFQRQVGDLRRRIGDTLRAAASWMAVEIAGRAFARRIKMPVPPEWLGYPRPWMLARIGNEVFWLVGETLRGTAQGVEFEATGILAGRPSTIQDLPEGIPFIPLVTVVPTRFLVVGIGCVMGAGEAVFVDGDPWLGMAVEIGYSVSAPVELMVGIGEGGLTEAWLGLAAEATYEIEGDEDEDESEDEGLTLEAEDEEIFGGYVVYDPDASSCYAVAPLGRYLDIHFSLDSTSLTWERPLRLRVVYSSESDGEVLVFVRQESYYLFVGSFSVFPTNGYITTDLDIPVEVEPFDKVILEVDAFEGAGGIRIDAIQIAPTTGNWPPLNPCSG